MPAYPPQHAGTTSHPTPKSSKDFADRTEDAAALAAPGASIGAFNGRSDFATPREGGNKVGEGVAAFNEAHAAPEVP